MNTATSQPVHRWLIFGAGAIGTYIGGSLALQGQRVTFLDRPQVRQKLIETGLRLDLYGKVFSIPDPVVVDTLPEALALGPYSFGVFALKSFDTQAALDEILPSKTQIPPILSLQNGVENESAISRALGEDRAISGTLTSAIGKRAAGEIVLERLRGVGIAAGHPLSRSLVDIFNQAGLNARLYASAPAMKWSKMLTNLLANASSAILELTPAQIFTHTGLYRLEMAQLREALQVMHTMGIEAVDLPATPVRMLAFAVQRLPHRLSRPLMKRAVEGGRGGKMPSFYIDLHSGRGQSEVDYLNGAVVRFGQQLGIPTPANRLLNETLMRLVRGELPLESFVGQPEKLLALWERS